MISSRTTASVACCARVNGVTSVPATTAAAIGRRPDSRARRTPRAMESLIPVPPAVLVAANSALPPAATSTHRGCCSAARLKRDRDAKTDLGIELAVVIEQALTVAGEILRHQPAGQISPAQARERVGHVQFQTAVI